MRVVAIANHKGGCGKTTTSIHWGACLAYLGKKVLLVDLDPQGHSTCGLGVRAEELSFTLYDLLNFSRDLPLGLDQIARKIHDKFWLIPSYGILAALEEELMTSQDRHLRLKKELSRILGPDPAFDFVILDCPPNLGLLTYNALEFADDIVIPIEPSFFSLHGLAKISETLAGINATRARPIQIHALLTLFDSGVSFGREVYEEVKKHFQGRLFKTIVHQNVLFKEAASAGKSIVDYDANSQAFRDYLNLAEEYLARLWDERFPPEELGWSRVLERRFRPRPVPGGVLFQSQLEKVRLVEIAGDFNGWIPEPMIFREELGLWQKVIPVGPGTYRYKFIVDGEWQVDPGQPLQHENDFGTKDSILKVP